MSPHPVKRKKVFVNSRIQGAVLWRIAGYWVVYHFVLWNAMFLLHFMNYRVDVLNGAPIESFGQLYGEFSVKYFPMLIAAVTVLPLVLYDSVITSHRIAGPLLRFRNTLRQLREGQRVDRVQLRKHDLLIDFQNEFNEFLNYYNAQKDRMTWEAAVSHDVEIQLLQETRSLSDDVRQTLVACSTADAPAVSLNPETSN